MFDIPVCSAKVRDTPLPNVLGACAAHMHPTDSSCSRRLLEHLHLHILEAVDFLLLAQQIADALAYGLHTSPEPSGELPLPRSGSPTCTAARCRARGVRRAHRVAGVDLVPVVQVQVKTFLLHDGRDVLPPSARSPGPMEPTASPCGRPPPHLIGNWPLSSFRMDSTAKACLRT